MGKAIGDLSTSTYKTKYWSSISNGLLKIKCWTLFSRALLWEIIPLPDHFPGNGNNYLAVSSVCDNIMANFWDLTRLSPPHNKARFTAGLKLESAGMLK